MLTVRDASASVAAVAEISVIGEAVTSGGTGVAVITTPPRNLQRKTGSSLWYRAEGGENITSVAVTQDLLYFIPFTVHNASLPLDQWGINVSTAAGAGGVARYGIYTSVNGQPAARVVEASGQANTTTTGDKSMALSQTLALGNYWHAVVFQVAAGSVRAMAVGMPGLALAASTALSDFTLTTIGQYYGQAGVTGALPATATPVPSALGVNLPRVMFRVT